MLDIFPGEVAVLLTAVAIAVASASQASPALLAAPAHRLAQISLASLGRCRVLVADTSHIDQAMIRQDACSDAKVRAQSCDGDRVKGAGMATETRQVEARA